MKFEQFFINEKTRRSLMTFTEKVTSGNRKIVRLPSGDFVNISFASYMDVGQECVSGRRRKHTSPGSQPKRI